VRNEYRLKLSDLAELIGRSDGAASSELIIATDRKDETVVKVPVATLITRKGE
jgi:hypothetical protein